MTIRFRVVVVFIAALACGFVRSATAQTQPPPPPPLWDAQVGGSFVGTSGNSDASSLGADFAANRRWTIWQLEASATAVNTSDKGETTAERYLALARAKRRLSALLSLSGGERIERDQFSGLDLRSVLDGGLGWALIRRSNWTLDGVTSIAWNHEDRTDNTSLDHPVGVLQVLSKIPFGTGADTTQRFAYLPDFKESAAYRSEAEITAQAAMTSTLALKFGYLWRYANTPVTGFKKNDNTTTASIVLRWKAATPAP